MFGGLFFGSCGSGVEVTNGYVHIKEKENKRGGDTFVCSSNKALIVIFKQNKALVDLTFIITATLCCYCEVPYNKCSTLRTFIYMKRPIRCC